MIKYYYPQERIAVIAMGGLFPDAVNVESLWNNIISKKVSIREIPDHLFNKNVFYRPEVFGKANKSDKSYTKVAAIPEMNDFSALTRKFRIPPAVAEYMDTNQLTIIYSVDQALQQMKSNIPKERTAVILGIGAPGVNFENVTRRTFFARVENALRSHAEGASGEVLSNIDEIIKKASDEVLKNTLTITEDSATGYLQNIMAARVSNIFDFWGPSYTIDAACASALAAVASAVTGLLKGEFDAVITGGAEVTMSEVGLAAFSGINALSPDGEYPFDSRANGFVMGLGGGVLILKRLSDALRDGDNIISVISGYGQGSDGKGKYIAAPSEEGQVRVIQDACKMAGYSADTIEFIEAHGTGTIVGDVVEISAMKKAFKNMGVERQNFCGIGSVKSNIGHLRNAAGSVSMIKASLALYNKVLPPTANIKEINPKLQLDGSPFYILTDGKQWNETAAHPRRANVSAYGFGGADYHICLEEFRPEFVSKTYPVSKPEKPESSINTVQNTDNVEEPLFFSGESFEDVKNAFKEFVSANEQSSGFQDAVFLNNSCVSCYKDWRLSICSDSFEGLKQKWDVFEKFIKKNDINNAYLLNSKGIFLGTGKGMAPCETAWMFPGQASQYPNMLWEIYENYPSVKSFYVQADTIWKAKFGYSALSLIFGENEELLKSELKNTKNTHPAIFLSNIALFKLLSESGIKADYMIGHSLGEITSLYASEMLDLKSAIELIGARGFSFDSIPQDERGQMVSIKSERDSVEQLIEKNGLNISIANINSRDQIVVGGKKEEITKFTEILSARKMTYTLLQVSHAFHTDITRGASDNFYSKIRGIKFNIPKAEVMCCHLSDFYPSNDEVIANMPGLLKDQIVSSVNFVDSVLKLYEKGVRLFIEAGPSSVLTNLVKNILADKDVKIIASNYKNKSSVEAYKYVLAELFTCGVDISMVPSDGLFGSEYEEPAERNTSNVDDGYNKLPASGVSVEKPHGKESLVYSGASVGLPGTFKKAFSDDNFNIIFEGNNLIEMLTDEEQNSVLDQNITRLLKTEGVTTFKKITSLNEVIHLAGKFGQLDMMKDYLIDEKLLKQMTLTVCAGVAAGYEVLKDAGIPLVREYIRTTSGSALPGRLVLPEEMRDDTGIIFASGLWPLESVIGEVSKYVANKFGGKARSDLIDFYGSVISKISDRDAKKTLSDWFTLHYSRLTNGCGEEDIYEFNHNFMLLLSSQANNRLAQFIGAAGPNLYISAACSSTASAVTVAEDMIRAGHARRIIVIGADLASTKNTLPWFAGGFLSMGALTDSSDLFEAAVPFDNRRNGMILGAGAVGLMVEKEEDVAKRGMNGICRILGTHMFNSGGHQTKIDSNKYCIELDRFIAKMENEHGVDRNKIASRTVYSSHETCSPKMGGCSETEKMAMEYTFKDKFGQLKVISTKGITGHTMGASIEEAVAAKALQYQKIPPVVNYREPDPDLKGLNLSQGGSYDFDYVLRSVIAFGGQGNYHLLQRIARGDERITDKRAYNEWLEKITSSKNVDISYQGRILTAEGDGKHSVNNPTIGHSVGLKSEKTQMGNITSDLTEEICRTQDPAIEDFGNEVLKVISEITRYPVDMLEKDMEMEADLGIDTVKQATIFSIIGEKFKMSEAEAAGILHCRTIGEVQNFVLSKIDKKTESAGVKSGNSHEAMPRVSIKTVGADSGLKNDYESVKSQVLELISEVTRYPVEMLENEMELEADLGIDTIKQATIFSAICDRFGVDEKELRRVSEFKTIGAIVDMIKESLKTEVMESAQEIIETAKPVERELCLQIPVFLEEAIGHKDYDLRDKHIWVIGNSADIVKNVSDYFKKISGSTEKFVFEGICNIKELEESIASFVNNTVDVIVDVNSLGMCMEYEKLSREEEERMLFLNSQARFVFYKKLSEHLSELEIRIVCAVSMDGNHGCSKLSKSGFNPFEGALCGFYKGLRKEWAKSKVKIIDFGITGDLNISDGVMLKLQDELEESSDEYEIGYTEGRRVVFKVDYFDRKEFNEIKLPDMPHFVISGGGNGIAAEIITGIAEKIRGKFTIIGRTRLPENIEQLSRLSDDQLEQKKLEIRDMLKKSGETASPVAVEREFEKLKKAVSVHNLINTLIAKGSDVLYCECDVRDYESLEKVISKATEKNGPIHAVIHAAGVEKSRLLAQKTYEEFNEIFSVKAHGICNLYRVIDKKELKVFIGFSSISGRFGNEAQLDYCSANSFISSFISMIKSKHSEIHALSIDWSGWMDTGMAWRNEFVRQNSEEMGINLIEPDRGTVEFIRILTGGTDRNEIIVSKGLSHFITPKMTYGKTDEVPQIDWVVKDGGKLYKAFKVLSVKRDPIINNHRLGKTPLMPAVGFMEILAEYHSLIFGKKQQYCFKNIRLEKPLKLFNEKPQEIMLLPGHFEKPDEIEGVFYTHFLLKNTAPELIKLNSMQVSGTIGDYSSLLDLRNVESSDMVEFLCCDKLDIYQEKTYNSIHLGTLFADDRCKANNKFKYNESAAVYSVLLPEEQITNRKYKLDKLLINPVFMDTLMQICGIHSAHTTERVYLPWEIGEFGIVKVPREVKPYRAYTKLKYQDDEVRNYDVLLLDENEEVCSYVKDVRMRRISV